MLASKRHGTLYVGVTSDLVKRVWEHRSHQTGGFTKRFDVTRLVYFERCDSMLDAITREKQVKRWQREWQLSLIEGENPNWDDLWNDIRPN